MSRTPTLTSPPTLTEPPRVTLVPPTLRGPSPANSVAVALTLKPVPPSLLWIPIELCAVSASIVTLEPESLT